MFALTSWTMGRRFLFLSLVIFLPAVGIVAKSSLGERSQQIEATRKSTLLLAQSLAAQQEQIAVGIRQTLSILAQLPEVQILNAEACNKIFHDLHDSNPLYAAIAAITPDGNVIVDDKRVTLGSVNIADQKYIKDVITTLDLSAGGHVVGSETKIQSINYAYPVLDPDKRLIAILIAVFNQEDYARSLAKADLPEGYAVTIADHRGMRLFRSPEHHAAAPGNPIPQDAFRRVSGDFEQGSFERRDEDGVERIYAFKRLHLNAASSPHLYLTVGVVKAQILHEVNLHMFENLVTLSLSVLLALSVAWIFGNLAFIKPIKHLVNVTQRFCKGEMGVRHGLPHMPDELGQIARAFDEMASLIERRSIEQAEAKETREEALRESEARLEGILNKAPSVIYVKDKQGRYTFVNCHFERLSGYRREEILGRTDLELFPQEVAQQSTKNDHTVLEKESPLEIEEIAPVAGEMHTFISVKFPLYDLRGEPYGICGISTDINERKRAEEALQESEERFRAVFELASVGMALADPLTGHWRSVNSKLCAITGYTADELVGMRWSEITHPDDRELNWEGFQRVVRGETPDYRIEKRYLRKDGAIVWVNVNATVLRNRTSQPFLALAVIEDITLRKRAEEERLRLERELRQAQKAESLGRMAGCTAHHFNNLLGAVMGNLELALDNPHQGSTMRACITEAMKATRRAAEISRLMLTYVGQTVGKREAVDLSQITKDKLRSLNVSVPENVCLKCNLLPEGPIILADAVHVEQILTNLVRNAGEAIGDREGDITVATHVTNAEEIPRARLFPSDWEPKAKCYACLSVSDTGCGLGPETQERIFDPFFSTKFIGRGLGLPVVLGLLRAEEGAITVESQPGRGATFRVFFPLAPQETGLPRKEEALTSGPTDGKMLVLLVDDDPMFRNMAEALLKRQLGYEVITAGSGSEAVEIFGARKGEINLVLIDVTMPGMDGWETLTALRALRPDLPVVFASGYAEAQVRQNHYPEQPQAFLEKPYRAAELKSALDAAWRASSRGKRPEQ